MQSIDLRASGPRIDDMKRIHSIPILEATHLPSIQLFNSRVKSKSCAMTARDSSGGAQANGGPLGNLASRFVHEEHRQKTSWIFESVDLLKSSDRKLLSERGIARLSSEAAVKSTSSPR
jgi:hypothetical protein